MSARPSAEHPALTRLREVAESCPDTRTRRAVLDWIVERVRCGQCESLLDKDAHTQLEGANPAALRGILAQQAKTRELELGRMLVTEAGLTEDFDIGYAVGRNTRVWVLR